MQQLPAGTILAYIDEPPVQFRHGLAEAVTLIPEWRDAEPVVQEAVLALDEDFDNATCSVCGRQIGGFLGYNRETDSDTFAFADALLVIDASGTTRYCYEDAVEQGYLTEDDEQ